MKIPKHNLAKKNSASKSNSKERSQKLTNFLVLWRVGITKTPGELTPFMVVVLVIAWLDPGRLLVRARLTVLAAFGHGGGSAIPRVVTLLVDGGRGIVGGGFFPRTPSS